MPKCAHACVCVPVQPEVVDDVTELYFIHEPGILFNLEARSSLEPPQPYTFMANVLVAVNPLRWDLRKVEEEEYHNKTMLEMKDLPPHPFALAENVYQALQTLGVGGGSQSCVINGESGAGKTESFKILLRYMLKVGKMDEGGAQQGESNIETVLKSSNPLMESFGNAKTSRQASRIVLSKLAYVAFHTRV